MHNMNDSINNLLEIKLERDELRVDNKQLQEANKRYHEHTGELQAKVEKLLVRYVNACYALVYCTSCLFKAWYGIDVDPKN